VDDTALGANTGASWANAYTSLQSALTAAASGDQIWVAQGTYRPATTANRAATFQLKSGVNVYGGFPEGGGAWEQRDGTAHATVLSGDLGTTGNNSDNAYHVVTAAGTSVLDGFQITDGNANGSAENSLGGGLFNPAGATLTVEDVRLAGNAAGSGGGIANLGTLTLRDAGVWDNSATAGGGIYTQGTASLNDVTLSGNTAEQGGGVLNVGIVTLRGCTVDNNQATKYGGGGLWNHFQMDVANCTISANSGITGGGGIYQQGSQPLELTNVTITGNRDSSAGGGIWTAAEEPVLHNTLVAGNFVGAGTTPGDVWGPFSSASSYNLIGAGDGGTGFTGPGNRIGTAAAPLDPLL
jgi:hypothetical protein